MVLPRDHRSLRWIAQGFQPLFLVAQDPLGNRWSQCRDMEPSGSRAGPTSEDDGFEQSCLPNSVPCALRQARRRQRAPDSRFPPGIGFRAAPIW